MRNDNLIRVIDALGEQIGERDRIIDIQRDENNRLEREVKEYQSIVCKLEREVEVAGRQIERLQQKRKPAVYCAGCAHCFSVYESFQVYCALYGIEFVSSNGCKLINAEEFSCPKAKAREDAE